MELKAMKEYKENLIKLENKEDIKLIENAINACLVVQQLKKDFIVNPEKI